MTMEKPSMMSEKEAPVKGIVAQVVTMLNGQAQRASLPVRTARLLQRSRTQTPSDAGISDGSVSPAPASLLQDVVDIKTLLLQLKRVLQESETLDPLLAACAESARGNGRRPPASPLHPDACAEMRRQILYLQSQLEERDRLVRVLQQQMLRMAPHERADDTCNVATQTDRLRPPMTSALTSSDNSGLVSWNEPSIARKLPSYSEAQKTKRLANNNNNINGTVNKVCQCGARRAEDARDVRDVRSVRAASRVGSRYLAAVAGADGRRYLKRDSSAGDKSERRALYAGRSRSIEAVEPAPATPARHHASHGDLCRGSRESVSARLSPGLTGHSTDTDYSSDGGYKSLPSSINCGARKVSGIPRRSLEHKFLSTRQVKASAV